MIGTWGGPHEPGTASIKLMHYQGDFDGQGPVWGYVEGGMGMVSFAIADAARKPARRSPAACRSARIVPGEGVEIEDGTLIRAATVVCNADPKVALRLLGDAEMDAAYRERLEAWKVRSPVVKFNARCRGCRTGRRRPGRTGRPRRRSTSPAGVEDAGGVRDLRRGRARGRVRRDLHPDRLRPEPGAAGQAPDERVRPVRPVRHRRRRLGRRRKDVEKQFVDLISRFAPDFGDCIEESEVLGPPDIEQRIGLTGGNIFQGEVTPDQMWEGRLTSRTPVPGLYFCGAATHPAGSVIALNGRNAATALLADLGEPAAVA